MFIDYCKVQKANLGNTLKFEPFAVLIPLVDQLYQQSIVLMPSDSSPVYGRLLLVCHKEFLAAASLVGQCQPDDADPITRRAIEAIRLAAAIKAEPKNAEIWLAYEKRMERWERRQSGEKPRSLHIKLEVSHPIVNELMETWGILSDAGVHFTPEYFHTLDWRNREGAKFLNYFMSDQRAIETAIVILTGTHTKILLILNECVDNAFGVDAEWMKQMASLHKRGKAYGEKFAPDTE